MANKKSLNAVVLGKSGVGKSSFLNYLVGKSVFQTGEGAPVTQRYFEHVDSKGPSGITYRLYDTKGAEPTTAGELRSKVLELIEKHDASDNMFDWIHTVYYCFAAPAKRIEPYEIELIKELSKTTTVIVLLTKKDMVSASELEALEEQIRRETSYRVQVLPVCSVSAVTRKGSSEPEGKEDVLKASFYGLWEKLSKVLPNVMCRRIILASAVDEVEVKKLRPGVDVWDLYRSIGEGDNKEAWFEKNAVVVAEPTAWLAELLERFHDGNNSFPDAVSFIDWDGFPDLSDLELYSLNADDRPVVKDILIILEETLQCVYSCDFERIYEESLLLIQKAQEFYAKLNGCSAALLKLDKSNEMWEEMVHGWKETAVDVYKLKSEAEDALNEISTGTLDWMFNSDGRDEAREAYRKLLRGLQSFYNIMEKGLDRFSERLEAELHQYAQYCILDEGVIRGGR